MTSSRVALLAVAAALSVAGVARAEPGAPGEYFDRREPIERDALFLGAALGSGTFVVRDIDLGGFGPHVSLRLGTPANERLLLVFQLDVMSAELTEDADGDEEPDKDPIDFAVATLGVKWHWRNTVWLRGGLGFARITRKDEEGDETAHGLGAVTGIGLDLLRKGSIILDVELTLDYAVIGGGLVTGSALGLGVTWY